MEQKINLKLSIKEITPYEALLVYRVNDVFINTAYSVGADSIPFVNDTISGQPYYYYSVNNADEDSSSHAKTISYSPVKLTIAITAGNSAVFTLNF